MLTAKSVIENKFYIIEDKNGKIGTAKINGNDVEYYNTKADISVSMTLEQFVADFVVENKNDTAQADYVTVFGYPTNVVEAFNQRSQNTLPVFTKKASSNIEYVAGYYTFEYPNNGWTRAYVPKLKTLDDYPWMGPFKTESDMLLAIRRKKKEL